MKKVLLLMFAALFTWASCSSDNKGELDGNWDEMKISAENVLLDTSKNEGVFINVSKEGPNFYLQVDNYNGWWVSSVSEKTTENGNFKLAYQAGRDKKVYKQDWYNVEIDANKAKCVIGENNLMESRTIKMVMTVGDAFKTIYIVQAAK